MSSALDAFAVWLRATEVSGAIRVLPWLWPLCEILHFVGLSLLPVRGVDAPLSFRTVRGCLSLAVLIGLPSLLGAMLVLSHAHLPLPSREPARSLPSPCLRMLTESEMSAASGLVASLSPGRSVSHQSLFA